MTVEDDARAVLTMLASNDRGRMHIAELRARGGEMMVVDYDRLEAAVMYANNKNWLEHVGRYIFAITRAGQQRVNRHPPDISVGDGSPVL